MTESLDSSKIITKEYIKLMKVMNNSQGRTEIASAENLLKVFSKVQNSPQFNGASQEDASEFLFDMVLSLDREGILKMKEKLTGQLTTTMICTTCNTPAQGQYNDFNCLTLFLPKRGFKTIDDALKKRFRATSLERTCPTCNSKRAQQREVINTLPQVLVLQKGRFQNSREKIQTDIHQKSD